MKGMSVTQRAKAVKQPRGGYIPPRMMRKTEYDDVRMLGEENVFPSVVGLAVDYLTKMNLRAIMRLDNVYSRYPMHDTS